jgi:hypothetical protein
MTARTAKDTAREIAQAHIKGPWSTDDYHLVDAITQALEAARAEALEESIAVYENAFEKNWTVGDTLDAIRALKGAE